MKKLLLLSSIGLLLGACAAEDVADDAIDSDSGIVTIDVPSDSIVSPEFQTIFNPTTTELRELSEADYKKYAEINDALTEVYDRSDSEVLTALAPLYGQTPEELSDEWPDIAAAVMYESMGSSVMLAPDLFHLMEVIAVENIQGENVLTSVTDLRLDEVEQTSFATVRVAIDEERYLVNISLDYSDDYQTAELTSFVVDGEAVEF